MFITPLPTALGDPEIQDIACGVWLSISPRLGTRLVNTYLTRWLVEAGQKNKVPMYFLYGAKDARRGVEGTFMWFMEEVGELSDLLANGMYMDLDFCADDAQCTECATGGCREARPDFVGDGRNRGVIHEDGTARVTVERMPTGVHGKILLKGRPFDITVNSLDGEKRGQLEDAVREQGGPEAQTREARREQHHHRCGPLPACLGWRLGVAGCERQRRAGQR